MYFRDADHWAYDKLDVASEWKDGIIHDFQLPGLNSWMDGGECCLLTGKDWGEFILVMKIKSSFLNVKFEVLVRNLNYF